VEQFQEYRNFCTSQDKLPSVKQALSQLLDGMIDYAGLFPPAQHSLEVAVDEFSSIPEDRAWMVDLFVCASNKLTELDTLLRKGSSKGTLPGSIIGNPLDQPDKALSSIERDMQRMEACTHVEPVAYEIRIAMTQPDAINRAVRSIQKSGVADLVEDVYIEFGWGSHLDESLHNLAAVNPDFGAKARTGGITADLFPSVEELALFIHTVVSIEIPFKFTAGLHEPLRYHDKELDVWRHGFLNTCLAGAFAMSEDLSVSEIEEILMITEGSAIKVSDDNIQVAGHTLTMDHIALYQDWFGGFGSCSVQEPVDGLKTLGYW